MPQFAVAVERIIRAPRSKVYRAFLDPDVLAQWMGPDGASVTVATVDERVGGEHKVEMLGSDGVHFTFDSTILELVPDERIVMTFRFAVGAEDTLLTVSFRDAEGGGTALRLEHERITLDGPLNTQSVDTGWSQTLAKLAAYFDKE
jgi:uncharacterized protein YndB with AHSA1/START domain